MALEKSACQLLYARQEADAHPTSSVVHRMPIVGNRTPMSTPHSSSMAALAIGS
jgi:hypothetical protein